MMSWTVWLQKPKLSGFGPLARGAEGFQVQLVHWTPEKECRVVEVEIKEDGSVRVHQSTTGGEGDPDGIREDATIHHIPGWEE